VVSHSATSYWGSNQRILHKPLSNVVLGQQPTYIT